MEIRIEPVRTQDDLKYFVKVVRNKEIAKTLNYLQNIVYRDAIDKGNQLYVAYAANDDNDGRSPVGALFLYFYKRKPVMSIKQIASLQKGVGGQLFVFACQKAQAQGIYQVTLEVTHTNSNAIAFYEHYGMMRSATKEITHVYDLTLERDDALETQNV